MNLIDHEEWLKSTWTSWEKTPGILSQPGKTGLDNCKWHRAGLLLRAGNVFLGTWHVLNHPICCNVRKKPINN